MENTLYSMMKNPLTEENLERIIESYGKQYNMYNALTRVYTNNKVKGRIDVEDANRFYVRIFEDWKRAITYLYKNDYIKREYKKDLTLVYYYIKDFHPTTRNEVRKIMDYESIRNEELSKALERFRYDKIGEYSGWKHIHSNYVNYGLHGTQTIRHRLYINCDSSSTYRIMTKFIEKCNARKLSYYFKFDEYGSRDDNLVIYSDEAHLEKYIEILREIKREENLGNTLHNPPVLTGKIDGWIGYGSEPSEEKSSFNEKRSNHIEGCIKKESSEWIQRNLHSKFKLNGKEITYKEYLLRDILKTVKDNLTKYARDDESYLKYHGFQKKDLTTQSFEAGLKRYINYYSPTIINYYQTETNDFKIEIPYKKGVIKISRSDLEEARKHQVQFMFHNSKRFRKDLLQRIKTTSKRIGIDEENYACDEYVLKELGKEAKKYVNNFQATQNIQESTTYKTSRSTNTGVVWQRGMTDEEIEASRRKLGM